MCTPFIALLVRRESRAAWQTCKCCTERQTPPRHISCIQPWLPLSPPPSLLLTATTPPSLLNLLMAGFTILHNKMADFPLLYGDRGGWYCRQLQGWSRKKTRTLYMEQALLTSCITWCSICHFPSVLHTRNDIPGVIDPTNIYPLPKFVTFHGPPEWIG